jgi:hypothetical protein
MGPSGAEPTLNYFRISIYWQLPEILSSLPVVIRQDFLSDKHGPVYQAGI